MKVFNTDERVKRIADRMANDSSAVDLVRKYIEMRDSIPMVDVSPSANIAVSPERRVEVTEPMVSVPEQAGLAGYVPGDEGYVPFVPAFVPEGTDLFSDEAKARRRLKQMYVESGFKKNAVSKAGARGLFQIMPITEKDYITRGKGKSGDIFDEAHNESIRDYVFSVIPKDLGKYWSEDDSDENKLAKLYAAYNWGVGNLRSYLRKKSEAGVDISDPENWVGGLNPETRNYVTFLAMDKDVDGTALTNSAFENAARKRGYMAEGGNLYEMGGPGSITGISPINMLVPLADKTIEKITEGDTARKIANWYHNHADKIPPVLHRTIYDTIKDSAFEYNPLSEIKYNFFPNLYHNLRGKVDAFDNLFLMSPEQQERQLSSLGAVKVDTSDGYGLVNDAVTRYRERTGRDVPMYQTGEDEITRDKLIPLNNDILARYFPTVNKVYRVVHDRNVGDIEYEYPFDQVSMGDIGAAPFRLYRDSDGNIYYKRWDFFDHGSSSRGNLDPDRQYYITKPLSSASEQYGDLLDIAGNPFVKTTGYTKVPDVKEALDTLPGVHEAYWNSGLGDKFYDDTIAKVKSGEFDIKASGGKIHIKPENRGKFNALLKRTGKSASWFKEHGTPAQKKMAVFALNSSHWGNRKDVGGENLIAEYPEGYNGELRQGKSFNAWDRYLANHPMAGHRLRKAKTLLLDAARIHPLTSFATDVYDSYAGPQDESDKITTPLGVVGRGGDIILNTVKQAGEIEPNMKKVFGRSAFGRLVSLPDFIDDSLKFVRDFAEPVTSFENGGYLLGHVYDLSEEQINELIRQGYEVERV